MTRPGLEPGPPRWKAGDYPPELWRWPTVLLLWPVFMNGNFRISNSVKILSAIFELLHDNGHTWRSGYHMYGILLTQHSYACLMVPTNKQRLFRQTALNEWVCIWDAMCFLWTSDFTKLKHSGQHPELQTMNVQKGDMITKKYFQGKINSRLCTLQYRYQILAPARVESLYLCLLIQSGNYGGQALQVGWQPLNTRPCERKSDLRLQ
jgi:hypothetical protein